MPAGVSDSAGALSFDMIPEKGILNKIAYAVGMIVKAFLSGLSENDSYTQYERNTQIFDDAIESLRTDKRSKKKKTATKNNTEKKVNALQLHIKALRKTLQDFKLWNNPGFKSRLRKYVKEISAPKEIPVFEVNLEKKKTNEEMFDQFFEEKLKKLRS